ncbi:MAG TPA: hypothetical protein VE173_14790, partial [Longimicrobiales bacterium]|nr:hypothetical protein [Longimicrobiales bacterium]
MDSEILGPEWFPRSQADRETLYERYVVETLSTNWGILANAARSSLAWAIKSSADLLTHSEQTRCQSLSASVWTLSSLFATV